MQVRLPNLRTCSVWIDLQFMVVVWSVWLYRTSCCHGGGSDRGGRCGVVPNKYCGVLIEVTTTRLVSWSLYRTCILELGPQPDAVKAEVEVKEPGSV
jgi:hypothetical protein